jgi:hypothetical protein
MFAEAGGVVEGAVELLLYLASVARMDWRSGVPLILENDHSMRNLADELRQFVEYLPCPLSLSLDKTLQSPLTCRF